MSNSINTSYVNQNYNTLLQSNKAAKNTDSTQSFLNSLKTRAENTKTTSDMSMDEYKKYVYDKIWQIPKHPTQAGANWNILISEDGFEAMKNDPDYEAWVLDTIKTNFSTPDPFRSSTNATLWIGATKDSVHGYVEGTSSKESKTGDSENDFWERRAERHREYMERQEE